MRRFLLSAVAAASAAGLLTACTGTGDAVGHPPHPAPTRGGERNDLPLTGGDPGVVIGTDWTDAHHAWGDTVVVYACVDSGGRGSVALLPSTAAVSVSPPRQRLHGRSAVAKFEVVVDSTAVGAALRVQQYEPDGRPRFSAPGPEVAADGDGWRFVSAG